MFCKAAIRSTKLFAALIIVLVASCKSSQKSTAPQTVQLDEPLANDKTLLWQVSGNGLTQPSYVFGTIHVIKSEDFFTGQNVLKKLRQSENLVLEMDLDNVRSMEVAAASILPDNKTIKDFVDPDDYLLLESFFADSLGYPMALFKTAYARLKPFFLQQMIYIRFLGDNVMSYETEFLEQTRDQNIKVIGLESLNEQLSFIDVMSIEEQYEGLLRAIRESSQQNAYLDTLVEAYKDKDIHKLYELVASNDEFKDISNTLIDERNQNWVPKLENAFRSGRTFVAVGAGHLGGEKGILQLLRDRGYEVVPVTMD